MSFETFHDFLQMGGHGPYVWWSYAAGAAVLVLNVVRLIRGRRRALDVLRRESVTSLEES